MSTNENCVTPDLRSVSVNLVTTSNREKLNKIPLHEISNAKPRNVEKDRRRRRKLLMMEDDDDD